jgi:hypothetical protein
MYLRNFGGREAVGHVSADWRRNANRLRSQRNFSDRQNSGDLPFLHPLPEKPPHHQVRD